MSANFFISAVTDEFRSYRERIARDLDRRGVRIETLEKFLPFGDATLLKIDDYIVSCDAVIHLAGDLTGIPASDANRQALLARHPDLLSKLGVDAVLATTLTYTQWEAWLAVYHGKKLFVAVPEDSAPRDSVEADAVKAKLQRDAQATHLKLLRQKAARYPEITFSNAYLLSIDLLRALLDLLPPASMPLNLPPSLRSRFKGRNEWLESIRRELVPIDGSTDARRIAIWGMGGIGKTQLAIEFGYTFAKDYSALLMVSAGDPGGLPGSVANLASILKLQVVASAEVEPAGRSLRSRAAPALASGSKRLPHTSGLPEQTTSAEEDPRYRAVLDWLDIPRSHKWLLIVDNVDTEEAFRSVEKFIRRLHHGDVLITSRIKDWPPFVTALPKLDLLSAEDSVDYLLEATKGKRLTEGEAKDRELASKLAGMLDRLPLALCQASASISARTIGFRDYLQEWEQHRQELLNDRTFDPARTNYPVPLAVTWLTSVKQLPPESAYVLDLLCWLAADPIPEQIFTQVWPAEAVAEAPENVRGRLPGGRHLLAPIYKFCLADPSTLAGRSIVLHPLVQEVGRARLRQSGLAVSRATAMLHLLATDFVVLVLVRTFRCSDSLNCAPCCPM